jgi:haloacetate dehalogenase
MDNFITRTIPTPQCDVFVRQKGFGPPLLLLHGFPQTGMMWSKLAPLLAERFTVVVADLPGYGRSGCPEEAPDHSHMSKRNMATTLVAAMGALGHDEFAVVGHDRGGRIAYRMALDHRDRITRTAVLDVIPTWEVWDRADAKFALAFWPFVLLAQPKPLPEQLLAAAPSAIVDNALSQWGSPSDVFSPEIRQTYIEALSDPQHAHAICEEYRAAATIDRQHDNADVTEERRISCPLLVLWSAKGPLGTWYQDVGGPLGIWRKWAIDVVGEAVPAGHFFPEEMPDMTAKLLIDFLQ